MRKRGKGAASKSTVAVQWVSQLTHAGPLVAVVHSLFVASDSIRREHEGCKLTEFFTNLRLLIGPLKIAPGALTRVGALPPVFESHRHTRRLEAWGDSAHLRVFRYVHTMAQSNNSGIMHDGLRKRTVPGIPPQHHRSSGVGQ